MQYSDFNLYNKIHTLWSTLFRYFEAVDKYIHSKNYRFVMVFGGIALLFWGLIFYLNLQTPFVIDDFTYYNTTEKSDGLMESIASIFRAEHGQYFTWTGRSVAHIIARSLLYINPLIADILNSAAYIGYCFLIYYHIKGREKHSLFIFVIVFFATFIVQPIFGETCLWLTGSANYLWATCIVLLFLLPYRMYMKKDNGLHLIKVVAMFLFGIIAGWTNENTAAALIILILIFIILHYSNDKKIQVWMVAGLIGCIIGYTMMIIAPGNMNRMEVIRVTEAVGVNSIFENIFHYTLQFIDSLGMLNFFGFIIFILFVTYSNSKEQKRNVFLLSCVYLVGTLVCLYVMLLSPLMQSRSWFGIVTLNIISFGIILNNLDYSKCLFRQLMLGSIFFVIAYFAVTYSSACNDIIDIKNVWKSREIEIIENRGKKKDLTFPIKYSKTGYGVSDTYFLGVSVKSYYRYDADIGFE